MLLRGTRRDVITYKNVALAIGRRIRDCTAKSALRIFDNKTESDVWMSEDNLLGTQG